MQGRRTAASAWKDGAIPGQRLSEEQRALCVRVAAPDSHGGISRPVFHPSTARPRGSQPAFGNDWLCESAPPEPHGREQGPYSYLRGTRQPGDRLLCPGTKESERFLPPTSAYSELKPTLAAARREVTRAGGGAGAGPGRATTAPTRSPRGGRGEAGPWAEHARCGAGPSEPPECACGRARAGPAVAAVAPAPSLPCHVRAAAAAVPGLGRGGGPPPAGPRRS